MEQMHSQLHQLMDDGKEQHLFKDLPNETLIMFIYGSLTTIAKKQNTMPEKLAGQFETDDLLNLCWDAIKA